MLHTVHARRHLRFSIAATLGSLVAVLAVSEAQAQECTSSADCSEGFECVKGMSAPGCATPPDCPDPTPVESETGWCEQKPVTCQTDADCPAFLKCVSNQDQTCWGDSEGNTGCDPVDPNAPKTCAYVAISCAADADCPDNFECADAPVACTTYDCPPDTECPPDECTGTGEKNCAPRQVLCQTNADCPTDWLCEDVSPDCATAPPEGGGGTEPGITPQDTTAGDCPDAAPVMMCIPPGFSAGHDSQASSETGGATAGPRGAESGASEDDSSGCSMSSRRSQRDGWFTLLAAAAIASVLSRRQRR